MSSVISPAERIPFPNNHNLMAKHTGSTYRPLNTCLSALIAQGKHPAMGALGSGSSVKEKQGQKNT